MSCVKVLEVISCIVRNTDWTDTMGSVHFVSPQLLVLIENLQIKWAFISNK